MMEYSDLKGLTREELTAKLTESKAALSKLKFAHTVSAIENPSRLSKLRRDIARVNTALTALSKSEVTNTAAEAN